MRHRMVQSSLYAILLCLNSEAFAEGPDVALDRTRQSNVNLPPTPNAKQIETLLSGDISARFRQTGGNACETIPPVGSCDGSKPIALMFYDPYFEEKEKLGFHSKKIDSTPPHHECQVMIDEMKKKGFCLEAFSVLTPKLVTDFLHRPEVKGRYAYLALSTHGFPGVLTAPHSRCEVAAISKCLNLPKDFPVKFEELAECVSYMAADQLLEKDCPCFQEQQVYDGLLGKVKSDPSKIDAMSTQLEKWLACTESNKEYYTRLINPADIGAAMKADGQVFLAGCATGAEPEAAKALSKQMCADAPNGMIFNLSRTLNYSPLTCSAEVMKECGVMCVANLCVSAPGQVGKEERDKLIKHFTLNTESYVEKYPSSLMCYRCHDKVAILQSDCNGLTNPFTYNLPYEEMPEGLKRQTQEMLKLHKKTNLKSYDNMPRL